MGKKTKVVIDTNVIISAFGWHGNSEEIVRLIEKGIIENYTSIDLLYELRKVLAYPKFNFTETLHAEIIETIFSISSVVEVYESIDAVIDDPEDNKILDCAVFANVEFIITGDKHLLNLKKFRNIDILTPEEFLNKKI